MEALAEERRRLLVLLEQPDRQLEQVLEVDHLGLALFALVGLVDAQHQVGRERRLVIAQSVEIAVGRDAPVLRSLDLAGEVGGVAEAMGAGQAVGDPAHDQALAGQDLAQPPGREPAQLRQRGGVEGAGRDAVRAQRLQARAHLGRRLVGEGHGQDPIGREGAACDLPGDPARDRGRLARARAGEDADGSARLQHGALLLGVETIEYR